MFDYMSESSLVKDESIDWIILLLKLLILITIPVTTAVTKNF